MYLKLRISFILIIHFIITSILGQDDNASFRDIIKLNQPVTEVGLPFIGDFHFKDYGFTDPKTGFLRYNYFLSGMDLYPYTFLYDGNNSNIQLWASFGMRLRVWNKRRSPLRSNYTWESSHAIKTPSFLPSLNLAYLINDSHGEAAHHFTYFEASFTHHSNGQDAPTLVSQDSTLVLPGDYIYNIVDGDFSSNYLTLKVTNTKVREKSTLSHSYFFRYDGIASGKFDLEALNHYVLGYNFRLFLNKKVHDENRYSHLLLCNLSLGTKSFSDVNISTGLAFSLAYHYRLPFSNGIAAFAKYGYQGQDDYNIFLGQSLHYARFGISISSFNRWRNEK